jgi:hypothetical protein
VVADIKIVKRFQARTGELVQEDILVITGFEESEAAGVK